MSGKTEQPGLDDLNDLHRVTGDDIGGFGSTRSMRLQMAMDRESKFMETLSNIRKRVSSTEDNQECQVSSRAGNNKTTPRRKVAGGGPARCID